MKEIQQFLGNILQAKDGYDLGEPWKFSKDAMGVVIPILCSKTFTRDYTTYPEVKDKIDFRDKGGISPITGKSDVKESVFIRAGTVLKGVSGQDRAVIYGMMMQPHEDIDVKVRCVHASRPTSHGGKFEYSGLSPRVVQQSLRKGQSETWRSVGNYYAMSNFSLTHDDSELRAMSTRGARRFGATSSISHLDDSQRVGAVKRIKHDDLPSIKEAQLEMDKNLQNILKQVPVLENQIGAVIVGMKGVVGVEAFNHSESWKVQYKEVIEQYTDELGQEAKDSLFTFDDTKVMEITRKFLNDINSATFDMIDTDTFTIRMKGYLGEAVRHNGHIVHMFVMENEEDNDSSSQSNRIHRDNSIGVGSTFIGSHIGEPIQMRTLRVNPNRTVTKGMKKGYDEIFTAINKSDGMATWSDLESESSVSTATLAKRLKEGKESNIIGEGLKNGRKVYYKKVNI